MLEMIIDPKAGEEHSWKMFFVGLVYGSLSLLLVNWLFTSDPVLSQYSGLIVVTFCVMFSLPFMYYILKIEEEEDEKVEGMLEIMKKHSDAIFAFMWLFLGFLVAFSFWHVILQNDLLFNAQLETYCQINSLPDRVQGCIQEYSFSNSHVTGAVSGKMTNLISIVSNNVYVMILTLVFSLIFGAGAIFILAWNASVIATAIGAFTKHELVELPLGLARYMIHGFPEIAAYFITALAGGMFGVGFIRHGIKDNNFWKVIQNVILLLLIALVILVIAGIIEVYITPELF